MIQSRSTFSVTRPSSPPTYSTLMQAHAFLINPSRGNSVDDVAANQAIKEATMRLDAYSQPGDDHTPVKAWLTY